MLFSLSSLAAHKRLLGSSRGEEVVHRMSTFVEKCIGKMAVESSGSIAKDAKTSC